MILTPVAAVGAVAAQYISSNSSYCCGETPLNGTNNQSCARVVCEFGLTEDGPSMLVGRLSEEVCCLLCVGKVMLLVYRRVQL